MLDVGQGSSASVALALSSGVPAAVPTASWKALGALPLGNMFGMSVSSDGTRIFATHGNIGNQAYATGYVINANGVVATLPNQQFGRDYAPAAWCNGKHYVFGGYNSVDVSYYTTTIAYTPAGTNGASGTWADLASMGNSRYFTGAATVGQYIYIPGGMQINTSLSSMLRYDTVSNSFTTMASMFDVRYRGGVVALGTKIYYLGGYNGSTVAQNTVYIYDTVAGTWSSGAPMPGTVVDCAATVVGGQIIVQNGAAGTTPGATYIFNGLSWSTITSPLVSHGNTPAMATIGNTVYLIAGTTTPNIEALDATPITDAVVAAWSSLGPNATLGNRFGGSVVSDGSRAYVISGWLDGANALGTGSGAVGTAALTIDAAGVTTALPTPASRADGAACFLSGRVWLFAGHAGSNQAPGATTQVYTPAGTNGASGTYTFAANPPTMVNFGCAAGLGNFIYLMTGTTAATITTSGVNVAQRFDISAGTWTTVASMPASRAGAVAVAHQGRVLVIGGYDAVTTSGASSSVYAYDPAANTWSTLAPLTAASGRLVVGATVIGAFVYALLADGTVWRFDGNTWAQQTSGPLGHAGSGGTTGWLGGGFVTIGNTGVTYGGAGTSTVDVFDASAVSPFMRRLRLLQQFLLASGLPVAASAARRIPTSFPALTWAAITPGLNNIDRYRYATAATSDGTNLIVTGGVNGNTGDVLGGGYTFSPTGTYTPIVGSSTTPYRYFVGGAFLAGKHYQIAGYNSTGNVSATSEAYNLATGTWANIAPFPQSRMYVSATALNGLIYATGGATTTQTTGYTSDFYSYNPGTNTWTVRASLPRVLGLNAIVAVNGFIYSFGGQGTDGGNVTVIYRYDPTANTWSTLPAILTAGGYTTATAVGSLIVIQSFNTAVVQVFNTVTGTITLAGLMTGSRGSAPSLANVGGVVMATGGSNGIATTAERLDLIAPTTYAPSVSLTKSLVAAGV